VSQTLTRPTRLTHLDPTGRTLVATYTHNNYIEVIKIAFR
jgi:hypothetical protein